MKENSMKESIMKEDMMTLDDLVLAPESEEKVAAMALYCPDDSCGDDCEDDWDDTCGDIHGRQLQAPGQCHQGHSQRPVGRFED